MKRERANRVCLCSVFSGAASRANAPQELSVVYLSSELKRIVCVLLEYLYSTQQRICTILTMPKPKIFSSAMLWTVLSASPVSDCFLFELDWRWPEMCNRRLPTLCPANLRSTQGTQNTHHTHKREYSLAHISVNSIQLLAHTCARAHTHVINKGTPKTSQSNLATKLIHPLQHLQNRSAYKHTAARFTFFYLSEANVTTTCQEDSASSCGEEETQRKKKQKTRE